MNEWDRDSLVYSKIALERKKERKREFQKYEKRKRK
jgi:hypothetical protein